MAQPVPALTSQQSTSSIQKSKKNKKKPTALADSLTSSVDTPSNALLPAALADGNGNNKVEELKGEAMSLKANGDILGAEGGEGKVGKKGPVEEMIGKRLRLLGKKIVCPLSA